MYLLDYRRRKEAPTFTIHRLNDDRVKGPVEITKRVPLCHCIKKSKAVLSALMKMCPNGRAFWQIPALWMHLSAVHILKLLLIPFPCCSLGVPFHFHMIGNRCCRRSCPVYVKYRESFKGCCGLEGGMRCVALCWIHHPWYQQEHHRLVFTINVPSVHIIQASST